jgi:hypothetical protein
MDHADRLVEGVVVDDEARMGGVLEHLHQFAQRDVLLDRDDIGPRHHEVVEAPLAQAQYVLEHPAFFGGKTGLGGRCVEKDLEIRPDRSGAPAEHRAQHAIKP